MFDPSLKGKESYNPSLFQFKQEILMQDILF